MFEEFKKFAMRGNVVDMAVGIVIGGAFALIVSSLVADVIMPPIGLILGNVDFANLFSVLKEGSTPAPYASLAEAKTAGAVTINYGAFINTIVSFIIVAFAIFLVVRGMNRMQEEEAPAEEEPTTKECPYCITTISIKATKCPNFTSPVS